MNRMLLTKIGLLVCAYFVLIQLTFGQSIRKHYEEMTDDERVALVDAFWSLGGPEGTDGIIDDLADFHNDQFENIHFNNEENDVFFAWHRMSSFELETAMKIVFGNPWISIGYWDWTLSASKADQLWSPLWLGLFNDAWSLGRSSSSSVVMPTQSDIDNALMESDFFQFSRFEVEDAPIHLNPHLWTDGVMTEGNAPKDPSFYFHHNMVDKIWADWYEIYGSSSTDYYIRTDLPRYPNVDPDDIVDLRSLGLFYAEAGLAELDGYSITNDLHASEKFGYQYDITASDGFIVPSGKDAEFRSCQEIALRPGFEALAGSNFLATIDEDCDFSTSNVMKPPNQQNRTTVKNSPRTSAPIFNLNSYPNPFSNQATIQYHLQESAEITIELHNMTGQKIKTLQENKPSDKGIHQLIFDGKNLSNGMYQIYLRTGNGVETIKLIKIQ